MAKSTARPRVGRGTGPDTSPPRPSAAPQFKHVRGTAGDCYARAQSNEPLFTFLGRDRHGAALVELWAFMREKEGEDPANVADAREAAEEMRLYAQRLGRSSLTLDSLVTLAASLQHEREVERAEKVRLAAEAPVDPVKIDDHVTTAGPRFNGHVGVVRRVFGSDDPETLRGSVNVEYRTGTVTVKASTLRKATAAERTSAGYR